MKKNKRYRGILIIQGDFELISSVGQNARLNIDNKLVRGGGSLESCVPYAFSRCEHDATEFTQAQYTDQMDRGAVG